MPDVHRIQLKRQIRGNYSYGVRKCILFSDLHGAWRVLETQRERRRGPVLTTASRLRARGQEGRVRAGGRDQSVGPQCHWDSDWDGDGRRGHGCGFAARTSLIRKMLFLPVKHGADASARDGCSLGQDFGPSTPTQAQCPRGRGWSIGPPAQCSSPDPFTFLQVMQDPREPCPPGLRRSPLTMPCRRHNVWDGP